MKEETAQVKVAVPIKDIWKAISSDFSHIATKIFPDIVKEVELLEGDGGLGSIFLFKFFPHVPKVSFQKEKIVEFDESSHQIALEVLEGGHLERGFTSYKNCFKLTEAGERETLRDVKVLFETKPEHTHMPGDTTKAKLHYIKNLENYLLNGPS